MRNVDLSIQQNKNGGPVVELHALSLLLDFHAIQPQYTHSE